MFRFLWRIYLSILFAITTSIFGQLSTNMASLSWQHPLPTLLKEEYITLQNVLQIDKGSKLEGLRTIMIAAILPIRCSECKQAFRNLQKSIKNEDIAPLMRCCAILRWRYCFLHKNNFTDSKDSENGLLPYFLVINTEENRQLIQYELTKGYGFREKFLDQIIVAACL